MTYSVATFYSRKFRLTCSCPSRTEGNKEPKCKKKNANTNRSQCSLNTNSPRANAAPGARATYLFAFHQVLKLKGQESERQDRRPSEAQTTHFFSPKRMHLYSCKTRRAVLWNRSVHLTVGHLTRLPGQATALIWDFIPKAKRITALS